MKITLNKDFLGRDELDSYIRSQFGEDQLVNKNVSMEISTAEASKLALDENTTVHGVKVTLSAGSDKNPVPENILGGAKTVKSKPKNKTKKSKKRKK